MVKNKFLNSNIKHFEELIAPIYEKLYKYIYCIVRNGPMAEDAMQNTLLNAYGHMSELRDEEKFSSWIFTIGKRESINILRVYKREVYIDFADSDTCNYKSFAYPDDFILDIEKKDAVVKIINNLKPRDRYIVLLRYYSDLPLQEIAEILNVNYNTIRTRHKIIKKKIYEELKSMELL